MADITNLSNFLTDIADAIRTKKETTDAIPAENFDTEILSIEGGIDTSDATANVDDIINPKTAYTANGKVTGSIIPDYSTEGEVSLSDLAITSSLVMQRQITDISTVSNVCIKYDSSSLYVYKIINNVVDYDNPVTYTNAELSITSTVGFGRAKLAPQVNSDGTISLVIVVAQSGVAGAPFYMHLYKLNPETLMVTHCAVDSTSMKAGNQYHWITTTTKDIDIAFSAGNKFLVGTVHSSDPGSWGNATGYFTFAHMQILDETSLSLLKNATYTTGAAGFGQGWHGGYPIFHMFYQDGYFQVYEEKNYRVTERSGVNTFTYWSMFLKESDYSFFYKTTTESTQAIYVECNGYIIGNGQVFKITDRNTVIGTTSFAPKFSYYVGVMGKSILEIHNNACSVYKVSDEGEVTLQNSFPASYGQYDNNNFNFVLQSGSSVTRLDIQLAIVAFNRKGIKYMTTREATAEESQVLSGKTAYSHDKKLTGTMPNNGTLNYTPGTENQAIPLGYTSGGTVIGDENLLARNIKKDVTIFGVSGTYNLSYDDATATANDILNPKTAYIAGGKVTGGITGSYGDTVFTQTSTTLSTDVSKYNENQLFFDINYELGLAIRLSAGYLDIYKIINGTINTANKTSISYSDLGTINFNTGTCRFVPTITEEGTVGIIMVVCARSSTNTFTAYLMKLFLEDMTIEKVATSSSFLSYSKNTEHGTSSSQWRETLEFIDNETFIFADTEASGVGYGDKTWRMHYAIGKFDINTSLLSKIRGASVTISSVSRGDDWDNSYPRKVGSYMSGKYFCYQVLKNYRGGTQGNLYYAFCYLDTETYVFNKKMETSDKGWLIWNDQLYSGGYVYNMSGTQIGTSLITPIGTRPSIVISNNAFVCNTTQVSQYNMGEPVELGGTFSGYQWVLYDKSNTNVFVNTLTSLNLLTSESKLLGMIRAGVNYVDTSNATATNNDMLEGKTAYVNGEKITGVIPDNGELNYLPSTSEQVIPDGYTSGGIIEAVTSDIDSNILAKNIRSGVTILGITGQLANCYTFATVEEMEANTDYEENTFAIVYGTTYVGTYRLDSGVWTQIGDSTEEQQIMDTLNEVVDTTDEYEGVGGTDEEVNTVLDEILGEGGSV